MHPRARDNPAPSSSKDAKPELSTSSKSKPSTRGEAKSEEHSSKVATSKKFPTKPPLDRGSRNAHHPYKNSRPHPNEYKRNRRDNKPSPLPSKESNSERSKRSKSPLKTWKDIDELYD